MRKLTLLKYTKVHSSATLLTECAWSRSPRMGNNHEKNKFYHLNFQPVATKYIISVCFKLLADDDILFDSSVDVLVVRV